MQRRIDQDVRLLGEAISSFREADQFARFVENALKTKGIVENAVDCLLDFAQGFLDRGEASTETFRGVQRRVWYQHTLARYFGIMENIIHLHLTRADHEETLQALVGRVCALIDDLLRALTKRDNIVALRIAVQFVVDYLMLVHCYMVKLLRPYHWQRAADRIKENLDAWQSRLGQWEELALLITLLQAWFDLPKDQVKDERYDRWLTRHVQALVDIKDYRDVPIHLLPASLMVTETRKWQDDGAWVPYQPQSAHLLQSGYFVQVLSFLLRPTHQTAPEMDEYAAGIAQMTKQWRRTHVDLVDFGSEEDEPGQAVVLIRDGWESGFLPAPSEARVDKNWFASVKEFGELDKVRWKA